MLKILKFIDKTLGFAVKTSMWISGFSVLLIIGINSLDTVGRAFFNAPLVGAVEMTELLLAICIILAIPYAQRSGAHIRVDMLDRFFAGVAEKVLNFVSLSICLAMFAILTVMAYESAKIAITTFESSAGFLRVPIWIGKILAFIGFSLALSQTSFELFFSLNSRLRETEENRSEMMKH